MNTKFLGLLLLLCTTSLQANSDSQITQLCTDFDNQPKQFVDLYNTSKQLGEAICLSAGGKITSSELTLQFHDFTEQAKQTTNQAFAGKSFAAEIEQQMQHFVDHAKTGIKKAELPSLTYRTSRTTFGSNNKEVFFSSSESKAKVDLSLPECQQTPSCDELFTSLETAIEQYKKTFSNLNGLDLKKRSATLKKEWIKYLDNARSQTLLDSWLTTYMELDYLAQDRLVEPMPTQWFLIHPSLVVENVSEAADGDQVSEALAIEWIGFNWWSEKTSPLGYPFGASLTTTYSDRAEIEDQGIGFMLHFNNSLSVGITDHDGDKGWFVTLDVLSLFSQKKQRWDDYWDAKTTEIQRQIENKI